VCNDAAGQKVELGDTSRRVFIGNSIAEGLRFHVSPLDLDPAPPLLICEGLENALSLAVTYPKAEVLGLPGVGRMQRLPAFKGRDVVVFRDGDPPDARASKTLASGT
jgi:hypothetical protein